MKTKIEFLAPNQAIIRTSDGCKFLQSYNSVIVKIDNNNNVELDQKYWNYSRTTGKYRNMFLSETQKETEKKIASGEYKLTNLN
jgi:hypothetical protein